MLSQLSKGYGSWTAGYVDPYFGEKKERECTLPEIDSQDSHFHGVTIGSRSGRSTAMSWATSKRSREPTIDGMPLPKTYTTRKGALQLFVGPDDLDNDNDDDEEDENDADNESYPLKPKYQIKRAQGQELIDLSLKLGTMERLAMSVLQFGDEDYDHEHTSVTDTKNKAFLKFIQSVDEARTKAGIDSHVQPGGDLKSYLKDLKTSAGSRFSNMYVSKSRESLELQAILRGLDNSTWPISYSQDGASEKSGQFTRPVSRVSSRGPSPGPPSTPRSSYQVLSAKKVAASIKSGSYLGRPSSRISAQDDDLSENEQGGAGHLTPASALRPTWTPTDSTDDYLIDTRDKFYQADDDGDSSEDGRKRRRFKERSFLTNNSQLYQGRNARKGEGHQRAMEVKVVTKGDGDSSSQKMSQIEEEKGDNTESKCRRKVSGAKSEDFVNSEDSDVDSWAVKVDHAKQIHVSEEEQEEGTLERSTPGGLDEEKDTVSDTVAVKVIDKRPQSAMSDTRQKSAKSDSRPKSAKSGSRLLSAKSDKRPQSAKSNTGARPDSAKSSISSRSSVSGRTTSTRAMSIVTLQAMNTPRSKPNNVDKYNLNKRRGTYAYDPDKGLVRAGKDRRKSDPFVRARSNSSHSIETPRGQNTQKRVNGADKIDDADGRLMASLSDTSNKNVEPDTDEKPEKAMEVDHVEQQQDQDDFLLDNIDECNEEIQQIEAQADHDSDSDSCMDEEVIKVILEGQKTDDLDEDHHQYQSPIANEILEEDERLSSVVEDRARSRSSGVNVDGSENMMEENNGETVDEIYDENASEIRSTKSGKSGRKSQSKRTKSVLESEDGGDSEYKLPVLDSDRLEEKDGSSYEDHQTGFSGSTASYSDVLAAEKLSELENGSQSNKDSSSQKLSRSSSAVSSKTVPQVVPDDSEATCAINEPIEEQTFGDDGNSSADNIEIEQVQSETEITNNDEDSKENDQIESGPVEKEDIEINKTIKEPMKVPSPVEQLTEEIIEQPVEDLTEDVEIVEPIEEHKEDESKVEVIEEPEIPKADTSVSIPTANAEPAKKEEPPKVVETKEAKPKVAETKVEPVKQVTKAPTPKAVEKKPEVHKPVKTVTKPEPKPVIPKAEVKSEHKPDNTPKPVKTELKPAAPKPAPVADKTDNKNKAKPATTAVDKSKTQVGKKDSKDKKEDAGKPKIDSKAVLEGEGLLSLDSELASRLDDGIGDGLDDSGDKDAHAIASELDALGLKKGKKGAKTYTAPPPGPRPKAPAEKQKIPDHLQDALNRRASQSRDYLEQDLERMTAMVGETLSGPTLEAVGEGLTEEELEIAKQLLQQKLDEAKGQLDGKPAAPKASKVKKPASKGGKKGKKKNDPSDEKTQEEMDREAIRAKRDAEQQLREQEAADLQRKIAENKRLLQQQADQTSAKSKELLDEMERLEREAADMQRAEDEARQMLADERKKQREERDARRKADLERKKQEAMDRREREKKELEEKRRKENEMMEKIADAEMRRRMREEEERRIDEEERLAQERYEAEMREAQRQEEEDEERLKEMERQAEEEAMQRLIEEREAAERERRRIREEEEAFREAEAIRLAQMAEEHKKLEEERARLQAIEDAKREAERQNLLKLRQMEEEARAKMQEEIEKRRADAMARRDFNLENKQNVDKLRHYQGLTRAWTFSYFVQWPRETYESRLRPKLQKGKRPFGAGDPRKTVKINNPPPKAPEEGATAAGGGANDVPTPIVP